MADDPREAAARYRWARAEREDAIARGGDPDAEVRDPDPAPARPPRGANALERAAAVESAIQQAIRRGDFDDLPGYGKPLEGLGDRHDPDWWIRRKIADEDLTGLGPPALSLRVEDAALAGRLDALTREGEVREVLEDFNRRVVEARRQLLGGPPVVTPTRDVDVELEAWRERRRERDRVRARQAADEQAAADAARRRRRWWRG